MRKTPSWTVLFMVAGALAACGGDKSADSGTDQTDITDDDWTDDTEDSGDTGETDVPVDSDGDGFTGAEGDCDDTNPNLFPFDRTATGGDVGCGYRVGAGSEFYCTLDSTGALECDGSNDIGQLNHPDGTFVEVVGGSSHACARDAAGVVACWGYDTYSQATPHDDTFAMIDAGGYMSCGVTTSGNASCWGGYNLGHTPTPDGTFTTVSAGLYHGCGVEAGGTLACWSSHESIVVFDPPTDAGFVQVAVGPLELSCARTTAGGVVCWGDSADGLDDLPTEGVASIGVSDMGTLCMLDDAGAVSCVGAREVSEVGPFQQMDVQGREVCTVDAAGAVDCW